MVQQATEEASDRADTCESVEPSPCKEGASLVDNSAWYIGGSSRWPLAHWTTVAMQPFTDTLWYNGEKEQSSQRDELRDKWMVALHEPGTPIIYTDSWAVLRS